MVRIVQRIAGHDGGTAFPKCVRFVAVLVVLLPLLAGPPVATAEEREPAILEPEDGRYLGFNLDWASDSVAELTERLGVPASSFVDFFSFPLTQADKAHLERFLEQVGQVDGVGVVTLEPTISLDSVTTGLASDLAAELATYNTRGVRVLVRFAHEMNGSWYSWSQQPTAYITAFRTIAEAIHNQAPLTGMLWAPNSGAGYPFPAGAFAISLEHPDFALLDTDGDGSLTERDDPYTPYYPGDEFVDWVGMSLYHWGNVYPWGENEIPEGGKFVAFLTGTYGSPDGDRTAVSDFYTMFSVERGKPLAIVETAALFNTEMAGGDELAIKQAWWRQVFDRDTLSRYPQIKMINWFEWRKPEPEIGGAIVDWTVTYREPIASEFREDLPIDLFLPAQTNDDERG